ncbi:hypothetical protein FO519_009290 [Halicephalobus sp. NKZ332]|nr:hypothetical protein FO519_009290 [Halicephalobus sp. NKZ332]
MTLNRDLYNYLTEEVIFLGNENPELLTRLMFSGKEAIFILRNIINGVDSVQFLNWSYYENNKHIRYSSQVVVLIWNNFLKIEADLKNPYMGNIIQWALSSVKRVGIDTKDPLPPDVVELLLKNPSLTKLTLYRCDLWTAKILIESRRFDYVKMGPFMSGHLNYIYIDVEELELCEVPLTEILNSKRIKTNSLIIRGTNVAFSKILTEINVSSDFEYLKKLELVVFNWGKCCEPTGFFSFLRILDKKLINLEFLTVEFEEYRPALVYRNYQGDINMPPELFKKFVYYMYNLPLYYRKIKVKVNHYIMAEISPLPPLEVAEGYYEKIREELPNFKYSCWIEEGRSHCSFNNSINITKNFEVNTLLHVFG